MYVLLWICKISCTICSVYVKYFTRILPGISRQNICTAVFFFLMEPQKYTKIWKQYFYCRAMLCCMVHTKRIVAHWNEGLRLSVNVSTSTAERVGVEFVERWKPSVLLDSGGHFQQWRWATGVFILSPMERKKNLGTLFFFENFRIMC